MLLNMAIHKLHSVVLLYDFLINVQAFICLLDDAFLKKNMTIFLPCIFFESFFEKIREYILNRCMVQRFENNII